MAKLRDGDGGLGLELQTGERMVRCVRCDAWLLIESPSEAAIRAEVLPPLDQLEVPRRGRALRSAIVLRLIAVERALHAVLFGALAVGLLVLEVRLPEVQAWARDLLGRLAPLLSGSGRQASQSVVVHELQRLLRLRAGTVRLLLITAVGYCLIEGVEAVGLWRQRRWAEYLTAVATAGFLPLELDELIKQVTVLRATALVVNLAVLVYLVWAKRLFGLRGGARAEYAEVDRGVLFGDRPRSPRTSAPLPDRE